MTSKSALVGVGGGVGSGGDGQRSLRHILRKRVSYIMIFQGHGINFGNKLIKIIKISQVPVRPTSDTLSKLGEQNQTPELKLPSPTSTKAEVTRIGNGHRRGTANEMLRFWLVGLEKVPMRMRPDHTWSQ
jgi:hypothetical protein